MTWTRLSDDFADHPELLNVSRSARLLHVEALVYGNRHGNDGRFRRQLVARMTDADDWPDLVDELLALGVWNDEANGYLSIDWPAWAQEPADAVRGRREANAERQRIYRERGTRHRNGDHSMCTDRCRARNTSQPTSHNALRDDTPSRPLPSRPEGEGGGDGKRGQTATPRSAGAPHGATVTPLKAPPGYVNPWDLGHHPTVVVNGEGE